MDPATDARSRNSPAGPQVHLRRQAAAGQPQPRRASRPEQKGQPAGAPYQEAQLSSSLVQAARELPAPEPSSRKPASPERAAAAQRARNCPLHFAGQLRHNLGHLQGTSAASNLNKEHQRNDGSQCRRRGQDKPPTPEPRLMSKGRRGGWSGCRGLHHRGCFLRQVQHLTATAASGKMGHNFPRSRSASACSAKAFRLSASGCESNWTFEFILQPSLGTCPIENIAVVFSNSDPDRAGRPLAPRRRPAC